jgi:hypothetical protein
VNSAPRTIFLSANSYELSNEWREAIIAAAMIHKAKRAQASFQVKMLRNQPQNTVRISQMVTPNGTLQQREVWRRGSWDERDLLADEITDGQETSFG